VIETTRADAAADAAAAGLEPPCLIVIGEVVKLRAALDWQAPLEARARAAMEILQRARQAAG
jgi:uroporphyrin-III C-methyltransferase